MSRCHTSDAPRWECPVCGHLMPHYQLKFSAMDFPCPRCGKSKYSEFVVVQDKESKKNV